MPSGVLLPQQCDVAAVLTDKTVLCAEEYSGLTEQGVAAAEDHIAGVQIDRYDAPDPDGAVAAGLRRDDAGAAEKAVQRGVVPRLLRQPPEHISWDGVIAAEQCRQGFQCTGGKGDAQ